MPNEEGEMSVLLWLLPLLVVRHLRREHVRTMSKSADKELSTLLPCFINLFVVVYCCLLFEKMSSLYHRAFLSVKRCFLFCGTFFYIAFSSSDGSLFCCFGASHLM